MWIERARIWRWSSLLEIDGEERRATRHQERKSLARLLGALGDGGQ